MVTTKKRFAFNVVANWISTGINMVVPFFLTPFVVHHLGPAAYGVWIIAMSAVSYLALLDLGLRSAIVRFVSKAQAQDRPEEARDVIGAALWFRLLIAAGISLLSLALALLTPHLFKIPPDLMRASQYTVLMASLGVGVTLVAGVFGAVLTALNRFDLLAILGSSQVVVRAGGVLLILHAGLGLISLACWELAMALLIGTATVVLALRMFPPSRIRLRRPDPAILRRIWSYSFVTFVFMIAVQIIVNTDNLVVGAFLSVTMVTFYAIGGSLITYAAQVSSALSSTFTPLASSLEASGQDDQLVTMLLRGTQAVLALVLPILVALVLRGSTFISLWMGPQYGSISERVLQILSIALYLSIANSTVSAIMMATERHKPMTRWAVYEAVVNFVLSLVLVKTIGLYGVAWGTVVATAMVHLGFWPRHIRDVMGVSIRTYVWNGWVRITLAAVPFAIACVLADRFWHVPNLLVFFLQIAATLPLYALGVFLMFRSEVTGLLARRRQGSVAVLQSQA